MQITPRSRSLAGFVIAVLCLLHCVGVALLAPVLPAALGPKLESPLLEVGLWLLAAVLTALAVTRLERRALWTSLFVAASTAGLYGLVREGEAFVQLSLAGFVGLQLATLRARLRVHAPTCPCCVCEGPTPLQAVRAEATTGIDGAPPRPAPPR